MSKDVAIVSASRTAIGAFNGGFATTPAHLLGAHVIKTVAEQAKLSPSDVSEVILGQVLTAGQGQGPARQASKLAGLADETPAWSINQICGSGLRAVALGYQAIVMGDSDVVIAGGQENMSLAQHSMLARAGVRMGNATMVDTMVHDGLWDAFNNYHMGVTAENVAKKFSISRDAQDAFAASSQQKYEAAKQAGHFDAEITPFTIKGRKGDTIIDTDEHPRAGTTVESLAKMRPAFDKEGSVTAGNASGLNDGAAVVAMMSVEEAQTRGLTPLAIIRGWAHAGLNPEIMGVGPIHATRKLLDNIGWNISDLDLIEANEAFAAQAVAVNNELGWDTDKVNVSGGAIALGHPIGASGARVLVTLLHGMQRLNANKGLATLCIGGGMGVALAVERP